MKALKMIESRAEQGIKAGDVVIVSDKYTAEQLTADRLVYFIYEQAERVDLYSNIPKGALIKGIVLFVEKSA